MDQITLKELENLLLEEKENLEENLSRIARPIDKTEGDYEASFDELGTDREDNATEVDQYSDNLPVEAALEQKLHETIAALERMGQGTYGICENCHKEIDIDRLRANPSAKTCIKC